MTTQSAVYNKVLYCDFNVKKEDDIYLARNLSISESVSSVSEMANSLYVSNRQQNKSYNFIVICGHGSPGIQGLGSELKEDYVSGKDFYYSNLSDIDTEITLISLALNTNEKVKPILFLAGCQVGEGDEGTSLLKSLSKRIPNVLVVASEDALTYQESTIRNRISSITICKLVKMRPTQFPPEFKFAYNGKIVSDAFISKNMGVKAETLRGELTVINNKF